jgi:hypothetical protein
MTFLCSHAPMHLNPAVFMLVWGSTARHVQLNALAPLLSQLTFLVTLGRWPARMALQTAMGGALPRILEQVMSEPLGLSSGRRCVRRDVSVLLSRSLMTLACDTLYTRTENGRLILAMAASPWVKVMKMVAVPISTHNENAYKMPLTATDCEIVAAEGCLAVSTRVTFIS